MRRYYSFCRDCKEIVFFFVNKTDIFLLFNTFIFIDITFTVISRK